jgi:hypothetical protein
MKIHRDWQWLFAQDAPKSRADKLRCCNLPKGKEATSVILFRDVADSIRRIKLLHHCRKFLDDPILLSALCPVQSDAPPDAFPHFMESPDDAELRFPPGIFDDLMFWCQSLGIRA